MFKLKMYFNSPILSIFLICILTTINCFDFQPQQHMFDALEKNGGIFDFGFTFLFVGVKPFEFEYYLFIGQHFWRVHKLEDDEQEICVEDLDGDQHVEFNRKYSMAFSYLSDHMVQHNDELNLTNHVLLVHWEKSNRLDLDDDTYEISESIFDANHDNLDYMLGADFYVFTTPGFRPSVAFQPQSFTDNEEVDGPNFVFIEQTDSDLGFQRTIQIHSIIEQAIIRNRTEQFGQYIPKFIELIDPQLYINVILPTRLGPEGVDGGVPAVILILKDKEAIKYCVTPEEYLDESCKPDNLKLMFQCVFDRDEL